MARASQPARPTAPPAGDERIVELTRRLAGVLVYAWSCLGGWTYASERAEPP